MKTRLSFFTVLAVLLAGLFGWHFFGGQPLHPVLQMDGPQLPAHGAAENAVLVQAPPPTQAPGTNAAKHALPPGFEVVSVADLIASPAGQARIQRFQQQFDGENSKPINVYGKIVDQYGQPVVGAVVNGGTMLYVSVDRSSSENFPPVTTDSQGQFSFVGFRGSRFGFTADKPGYEFNYSRYVGWYDSYKPDPNNPTVFTMWKLKGAEPMVHARAEGRVPYDSQASEFVATFYLATGKRGGAGELLVTLTQNPLVVRRGVDHYDWSVKIEVLGGGLVEATDPYKNLAPETGYQPAFAFAQAKADPKWQDRFIKTFYVRTAQAQYGRLLVDLTPGTNRPDAGLGIGLSIETWLNPGGSRNLEFDEAKQVRP
jgi:hypothetical protein